MSENLHIKNATIIDRQSTHHLKQVDIVIEKGVISKIEKDLTSDHPEYTAPNLHVSQGWIDLRANFCDPGFEHKEDISSGLKAASMGGYTGVVVSPSTMPVTDSKAGIEYMMNKADHKTVELFPMGAISQNMKGESITEMYDMKNAGAVGFTDNKNSIQNPELLKTALLYAKSCETLVVHFPSDRSIASNGQVNEGINSTKYGIKGIPALAEELIVARDIFLTEYTNSKIHITGITTEKSVDLIRQAKKKGIKITCDIIAHHLLLDDSKISSFDTNFKLLPPLREKKNINALHEGLNDGTIDAIISDHTPHEEDAKKKEFDLADFGIIGLESCFGVITTGCQNKVELTSVIDSLTSNPRAILDIPSPSLSVGQNANLTFFDPSSKWVFEEKHIASKSKNSPYLGRELTGKVFGSYNKKNLSII